MTDHSRHDRDHTDTDAAPEVHAQSVATARILTKISELETANTGVDFTDLKRVVLAEDAVSANQEADEPGPLTTEVPPPGVTTTRAQDDAPHGSRHQGDPRHGH